VSATLPYPRLFHNSSGFPAAVAILARTSGTFFKGGDDRLVMLMMTIAKRLQADPAEPSRVRPRAAFLDPTRERFRHRQATARSGARCPTRYAHADL
jgi:hypothetical protein